MSRIESDKKSSVFEYVIPVIAAIGALGVGFSFGNHPFDPKAAVTQISEHPVDNSINAASTLPYFVFNLDQAGQGIKFIYEHKDLLF